MKVTIENLVNYNWNSVNLYGSRRDESTWRWDTEKRYTNEEVIATASEVYKAATGYDSLEWEMETEEGENGYEDECASRDDWMNEIVEFYSETLEVIGI